MIYTVTFNPSIDYIVSVDDLKLGSVNRTSEELMFPGGKGINVSMVLSNIGIENTALGFLAGFTGDNVQKMLEDRFDKELKMVNLRMKYYKEFKRILSPKQIVRIFQPGFGDRNMMHQPFFANKGGRMMPQGGQQNMKWNKQNRQDKQEFPQQPITTDKN